MFKLIKENYRTYSNADLSRSERHWWRFFIFIVLASLFTLFAQNSSSDVYSLMVTGITILTGFVFTALFSDHALSDVGLPKANDETDRQDIRRLAHLSDNFHARSAYFIAISIIGAFLLIVQSIDPSVPETLVQLLNQIQGWMVQNVKFDGSTFLSFSLWIASILISLISIFIYLECVYSFYRLSETMLAIVNTRREYLKAAERRG